VGKSKIFSVMAVMDCLQKISLHNLNFQKTQDCRL
jgi:hypothetical protein